MNKELDIVLQCPGDVNVPPRNVLDPEDGGYGGTEEQKAQLAHGLAQRGHRVWVTGAATSTVEALHPNINLLPICDEPVSHMDSVDNPYARTVMWQDTAIQGHKRMMEMPVKPDVIINSTGHLALAAAEILPFEYAQIMRERSITITHGRLDYGFERERYMRFRDYRFVAISAAQQKAMPQLNWHDMIHHGIDLNQFSDWPAEKKKDQAIFLGRICWDKGTHLAIEATRRAGIPFVIAAKVDKNDREYFERYVEPHIDGDMVRFEENVNPIRRDELLGESMIAIHPNESFPEPFGLALVEALACRTPVIGWNNGSVPEIVQHGKTGFVCDSVDDIVEGIHRRFELDFDACREDVLQRFTKERMVDDYELTIQALMRQNGHKRRVWNFGRIAALLRPASRQQTA